MWEQVGAGEGALGSGPLVHHGSIHLATDLATGLPTDLHSDLHTDLPTTHLHANLPTDLPTDQHADLPADPHTDLSFVATCNFRHDNEAHVLRHKTVHVQLMITMFGVLAACLCLW